MEWINIYVLTLLSLFYLHMHGPVLVGGGPMPV